MFTRLLISMIQMEICSRLEHLVYYLWINGYIFDLSFATNAENSYVKPMITIYLHLCLTIYFTAFTLYNLFDLKNIMLFILFNCQSNMSNNPIRKIM